MFEMVGGGESCQTLSLSTRSCSMLWRVDRAGDRLGPSSPSLWSAPCFVVNAISFLLAVLAALGGECATN